MEERRKAVEALATAATEIVAKPAVGASGKGTCKLDITSAYQANIEDLVGQTDVLLQVHSIMSAIAVTAL